MAQRETAGLWVLIALLALAGVLTVSGLLAPHTQTAINLAVVGYSLGRAHAAHLEAERARRETVAALSAMVSDMGSALASGELDDDDQAELQRQRAQVMDLLGLIDPPRRRRVPWRVGGG